MQLLGNCVIITMYKQLLFYRATDKRFILDYVYYHFRTDDIHEVWDTGKIEAFLKSTGLFSENSFTSQRPFLSVSLMCVKDHKHWNENDYDAEKTNYIAVVTSDDLYWGIKKDPRIGAVLEGLEELLDTELRDDW